MEFAEYIWLVSRIVILVGTETNPGAKHSFSSQTAYYLTCKRKFLYYRSTFLSPNLILFVSQKLHLMMTIWKYVVTTLLQTINHLTLNVWQFAFSIKTLSFKLISIQYLQECISFEIRIGEKCFKFICLYRSPSQTND